MLSFFPIKETSWVEDNVEIDNKDRNTEVLFQTRKK